MSKQESGLSASTPYPSGWTLLFLWFCLRLKSEFFPPPAPLTLCITHQYWAVIGRYNHNTGLSLAGFFPPPAPLMLCIPSLTNHRSVSCHVGTRQPMSGHCIITHQPSPLEVCFSPTAMLFAFIFITSSESNHLKFRYLCKNMTNLIWGVRFATFSRDISPLIAFCNIKIRNLQHTIYNCMYTRCFLLLLASCKR